MPNTGVRPRQPSQDGQRRRNPAYAHASHLKTTNDAEIRRTPHASHLKTTNDAEIRRTPHASHLKTTNEAEIRRTPHASHLKMTGEAGIDRQEGGGYCLHAWAHQRVGPWTGPAACHLIAPGLG
jgi:hypothetical protein